MWPLDKPAASQLRGRPPSPPHVTVPPLLSQGSYLINDHNVHDDDLIKKITYVYYCMLEVLGWGDGVLSCLITVY